MVQQGCRTECRLQRNPRAGYCLPYLPPPPDLPTYLPTYLPPCLPACLPTYLPLPSYLPASTELRTHRATYLPTQVRPHTHVHAHAYDRTYTYMRRTHIQTRCVLAWPVQVLWSSFGLSAESSLRSLVLASSLSLRFDKGFGGLGG